MSSPKANLPLLAAAVLLGLAAPARAAGTWTFDSWSDGFTPAEGNLIRNVLPSSYSGLSNSEGGKNVAYLTDGVALPGDMGGTQCLGNNAVLTWTFDSPVSIREVKVYTTWGDRNRSAVNIASVVTDGTNTIGGATGSVNNSQANCATLASETGAYLAEGVSRITISFGAQQYGYVGHAEIEVAGIVGVPGTYVGIVGGTESDLAPCAGSFSLEATTPPAADATIEWLLDGVPVGTGPILEHVFSDPGSYTLAVAITEGGVTRSATKTIVVYGSVVYVDGQCANPAYPYGSRATAARDVADVVEPFMHAQEMRVYPGRYTTPVTFTLEDGRKITGMGDAADTVIRTSTRGQIVRATGAGSEIRNLTLANGAGANGACARLSNGARADNCRFVGGACGRTGYGGCLYVEGDATIVSNCVIGNVRAGTDGQASNNPIYYGLGLYLKGGLVTHCVITNVQTHGIHRTARHAQGVAVQIAGGTLRNCLVAHNLATDGQEGSDRQFAAGIYQTGGTVENCTVTDNSAQSGPAGYCRANGGTMVNGIVWGNANDDGDGAFADADVSGDMAAALSHSCTNNPLFKAPAGGDFRLMPDSPCANAGLALPWITREATDLAGARRLVGRTVDLGCYEIAIFPTTLTLR